MADKGDGSDMKRDIKTPEKHWISITPDVM